MAKFGSRPCTIVQGLLPNFGAALKICKKKFGISWNIKINTLIYCIQVYDMLYKAGAAHEMELEFCPQDDGSHVTITLDKSKPLGLRIKEDNNGMIGLIYTLV